MVLNLLRGCVIYTQTPLLLRQCPVNCVVWSPFNPDVFLSCSSDWTIQLWKQHHLKPMLGFTSAQKAVYDIKWSPKWPTVFGAVTEGQLEIWDLSSSM